jgi:hypothetical protein
MAADLPKRVPRPRKRSVHGAPTGGCGATVRHLSAGDHGGMCLRLRADRPTVCPVPAPRRPCSQRWNTAREPCSGDVRGINHARALESTLAARCGTSRDPHPRCSQSSCDYARMREDELTARIRYHEDRLREAERLAAYHQQPTIRSKSSIASVRSRTDACSSRYRTGPAQRRLTRSDRECGEKMPSHLLLPESQAPFRLFCPLRSNGQPTPIEAACRLLTHTVTHMGPTHIVRQGHPHLPNGKTGSKVTTIAAPSDDVPAGRFCESMTWGSSVGG